MLDALYETSGASRFFVLTAARKGMLRKIAGNGSESGGKGDSKGNPRVMEKEKMMAQRGERQ